jgi:signal transduction histidine kinase
MMERRVQIGAALGILVGLVVVEYLVNALWVQGLSMPLIQMVCILGAALVTLTANAIAVSVVIRYRRVVAEKNEEIERLAAIGEIVAHVAHYQKNLLNGLRGGLYVANGAIAKGDWEETRNGWRMLHGSVQRIERLTLDMLYYVKGRIPKREPIDVNEVIQEVVDLMRETAASRNVELAAEFDMEIGKQALDRTAIYRAILDLVSNAIDACAESESGKLVSLKSHATTNEIVVTVADDGVGMSDQVRSNLFVRFFSTKGGQGTGLGLPVVKKVVEEHKGILEVESEVGEGSTFHLRFPKSPALRLPTAKPRQRAKGFQWSAESSHSGGASRLPLDSVEGANAANHRRRGRASVRGVQ